MSNVIDFNTARSKAKPETDTSLEELVIAIFNGDSDRVTARLADYKAYAATFGITGGVWDIHCGLILHNLSYLVMCLDQLTELGFPKIGILAYVLSEPGYEWPSVTIGFTTTSSDGSKGPDLQIELYLFNGEIENVWATPPGTMRCSVEPLRFGSPLEDQNKVLPLAKPLFRLLEESDAEHPTTTAYKSDEGVERVYRSVVASNINNQQLSSVALQSIRWEAGAIEVAITPFQEEQDGN